MGTVEFVSPQVSPMSVNCYSVRSITIQVLGLETEPLSFPCSKVMFEITDTLQYYKLKEKSPNQRLITIIILKKNMVYFTYR